jgi:hypothetical protein
MPGSRHPDKALFTLWTHKDIHAAVNIVAKVSDQTVTRFILEAIAQKMGFKLDEVGNPVGLDIGELTRQAFEKRVRPARRKKAAEDAPAVSKEPEAGV